MTTPLKHYLKKNHGAQSAIARDIGVTPPYIWQIVNGMREVPAERVLAIEAATDYQVSRHELRPDLYPQEEWCRCLACERKRKSGSHGVVGDTA